MNRIDMHPITVIPSHAGRCQRPWARAAALATALTFFAAASVAAQSAGASGAKAALTVHAVKPQPGQWTSTLAVNGSIAAWSDAVIGSPING